MVSVVLDWKTFAVLGITALGFYAFSKLDPPAVKEVSIYALEALSEGISNANSN